MVYMTKAESEERKRKVRAIMVERDELKTQNQALEAELKDLKSQRDELREAAKEMITAFRFLQENGKVALKGKSGRTATGIIKQLDSTKVVLEISAGSKTAIARKSVNRDTGYFLAKLDEALEAEAKLMSLVYAGGRPVIGAGATTTIMVPEKKIRR